jgi:hypothetical protein
LHSSFDAGGFRHNRAHVQPDQPEEIFRTVNPSVSERTPPRRQAPNARLIVGSAPRDRAASAGGLVSTTRLGGQTMGATGIATMLALGFGTRPAPALAAAVLTIVAGLCGVSLLRPSIRNPTARETSVAQPGSHGDVGAA